MINNTNDGGRQFTPEGMIGVQSLLGELERPAESVMDLLRRLAETAAAAGDASGDMQEAVAMTTLAMQGRWPTIGPMILPRRAAEVVEAIGKGGRPDVFSPGEALAVRLLTMRDSVPSWQSGVVIAYYSLTRGADVKSDPRSSDRAKYLRIGFETECAAADCLPELWTLLGRVIDHTIKEAYPDLED